MCSLSADPNLYGSQHSGVLASLQMLTIPFDNYALFEALKDVASREQGMTMQTEIFESARGCRY